MRRIKIFLFWLLRSKHNVSLAELLRFSFKPTVRSIARRYLKNVELTESFYQATFRPIGTKLFWPKECPISGIYQVTSETFDQQDWHYYQKPHTQIEKGELLLDVGAAEGLFSLTVVDYCEKIILIEPNDYFVKALKRTFALYQEKVSILDVAVGSENGEVTFNPDSLIGKVSTTNQVGNKKRLATIDDLIGDTKITYLKADLEGFEVEMLKGAENTIKLNKPKIAITAYHPENDADEIIELVKSFVSGYQHYTKGISQTEGKPVMIHFWV